MYLYLLSSCKEELLNRQREGVTSIRSKNILSRDTTPNEVSTVSRDINNSSGRHASDCSVDDEVSNYDLSISSGNDEEMRQSKSNNL